MYFGNDWSAENRTSSHHIARRLARHTRVLYVEAPGLRSPKFDRRDIRKTVRKLRLLWQRPRFDAAGLSVVTLPQIPFRRLAVVRACNRWLAQWLVRRAMRFVGFSEPVLWFAIPHLAALAGRLGERFCVYYCIDDYAALPNVDSREVARMDEDLTRRADQVFVASTTLLEKKRALNSNTRYSPHGVDVDLFRRACDPHFPAPAAARHLHHPVVGFFGLIEAWIDLDLLLFLAKKRPEWTLLLIGRAAVDLGELASLPNVVLVGPQRYEDLPGWASVFDVAILPYRRNRQVLNSNPLKLREYLAAGKPVVSVSAPEISRFADVIRIADEPEEFLRGVEAALQDSAEVCRRGIDAVSDMSWESRVAEVWGVVEDRLRMRQA